MSIHRSYHLWGLFCSCSGCVHLYICKKKKKWLKKNWKEKKMMMKKKTHVCIIFYHWVCILMFEGHLIEYVCWWEFVCELSDCIFWEQDEWPSLRSSGSLSLPSLHSLLMWLHSMFDLSWSLLLFVLFVSSSSSFSLLIHHFHFTSYSSLTTTHLGFDTLFASSLHISLLVHFASFVFLSTSYSR